MIKKSLKDLEKIIEPFSKRKLKRTQSFENWKMIPYTEPIMEKNGVYMLFR